MAAALPEVGRAARLARVRALIARAISPDEAAGTAVVDPANIAEATRLAGRWRDLLVRRAGHEDAFRQRLEALRLDEDDVPCRLLPRQLAEGEPLPVWGHLEDERTYSEAEVDRMRASLSRAEPLFEE